MKKKGRAPRPRSMVRGADTLLLGPEPLGLKAIVIDGLLGDLRLAERGLNAARQSAALTRIGRLEVQEALSAVQRTMHNVEARDPWRSKRTIKKS